MVQRSLVGISGSVFLYLDSSLKSTSQVNIYTRSICIDVYIYRACKSTVTRICIFNTNFFCALGVCKIRIGSKNYLTYEALPNETFHEYRIDRSIVSNSLYSYKKYINCNTAKCNKSYAKIFRMH